MKKVLALLVSVLLLLAMIPMGAVSVSAYAASRDDGVWLFPLPKMYYNKFSDWAGCPGNDKCVFCGTYHSGWGDSAHTGQGGHNGFDIAAPSGTEVYASAAGVAYAFNNSARGNTVVIEHAIGNGYSYYTYYQHLLSYSVNNGQAVKAGDVIGKVGNTGDSGGNHLHFGMLMGTSGQKGTSSLLNQLEGKGWITTEGYKSGRILNNPASTNDAGFPTGNSAVVPPLKAHYGSTHYTFDVSKVSIGGNASITYSTISTGIYFIKNKGTGKYLDVSQGKDEQLRNILAFSFHGDDNQKFEVIKSTTTAGYAMRPLSSASRKVNVEADTVVSGKNVCIYDDTGHDSQRWNFETVDGGYVIRNVQVPSCVLDVEDGENVYVSTYTSAASQIWTLENVVSYDANGGMGAPELQLKNYNESITLSTTKPSKDGYVFKGWATDASATEAQYASGGEYKDNVNIKLYAVWECDHTYETVVTNPDCLNNGYTTYTCSMCGDSYVDNYIDFVGHSYTGKITTPATCGADGVETYTCSACGDSYTEAIPATGKHTYDNDCDTTCNTCGEERSIKHSYSAATCTKPETCTVCGVTQGTALGHTFDDEYDATCNACGDIREVPDKPIIPDLPADAPAFVVESTTARAGEEFTIAIRTERNSGIVSFKLSVGYDSDVLELVAYEQKDFANMSFGPEENNPFILNWVDAVHPNNSTNGVVVLLTFRVKEGASEGETAISVTYDADDVYDENFDNVGFRVENGVVEIVEYTSGDVTGDGKINNKDLGRLQQHLNDWAVDIDLRAADVTGDGKVNNKDLGRLQQYLNGGNVDLG